MQRFIRVLKNVLDKKSVAGNIARCETHFANCKFSTQTKYFVRFLSLRSNGIQTGRRHAKRTFNINDLLEYIYTGKTFYLKQLTNIFHTINFDQLQSKDAELLLQCCGSLVPDSSREHRNKVCQDIFTKLITTNNVDINIYNAYLKTCTENAYKINFEEFLNSLKCAPNRDTFRLLLENVCQFGQTKAALEILTLMKQRNISVDLDTFNNLVLSHTIEGGLKASEAVLNTMRLAQLPESTATKLAIFRGLILRKDLNDFKKAVELYPIKFTEKEFLVLLQELGLAGNESWLSQIEKFYKDIPITRECQTYIEKICVHLVHTGQPLSAMNIFQKFVNPHPDVSYGFNLLKEMLHCNVDINLILMLSKELMDRELNPYILENLTEVALRLNYAEQAWVLLKNLNTLRPHYFWPLFVHKGKQNGQNGVFSVLKKMKELNVKPDSETLERFVFPYCDLSSLNVIILKMQEECFTIKEILSPLIVVLLRAERTTLAADLCGKYNVKIFGEHIPQLLWKSWQNTKDTVSLLPLLKRYCESNPLETNVVGNFLISCCKFCTSDKDFIEFLTLVKELRNNNLKINSHSEEVLQKLKESCIDGVLRSEIGVSINSLLDFGLKVPEEQIIPHPKDMNLEGLENHFIELKEKNMNCRGVIRKLIQLHANRGNLDRVIELKGQFAEAGYQESAGMKSSTMHSFILGGHVDEALYLYEQLTAYHPDFILDHFKYIDLVKLLIENGRFEEGLKVLETQLSRSQSCGNSQAIQRNCRELLSSCSTDIEINVIFKLLLDHGLIQPTNVILGPLVKIHLKSGDVSKAVETYAELSSKYNCTPLQLEVLSAASKLQDANLLERVLKATESVHGPGPTQLGLIAALAENGQEKALRKVLGSIQISIKALLERRCNRWVQEKKINPLKTLAKACYRISENIINVNHIYECIFGIYEFNGDYAGLKEFYESLPEDLSMSLDLKKYVQKINKTDDNVNISNKI